MDTEKIGKSDTWLRARTGYVRAHLLLLWTEAWEQKPCGSLPNDDELIALLLDMEPDEFAKRRAVLMRGWWEAEDGRLYHDTIVARVLDMIEKRMSNAERARRSRERKAQSHDGDAPVTRDAHMSNTGAPREFDTKNQEPGTSNTPPDGGVAAPKRPTRKCPPTFEVTEALVAWAAEKHPRVDIATETEKFRDHTFKTAISDWAGAWRNWIRGADGYRGQVTRPTVKQGHNHGHHDVVESA